ncbi:MAG: hypothetical protein K5776_02290 [Lachnospiraceae bacterium]|nr:hypothetical protein [Lachnospiraceae bacterium]
MKGRNLLVALLCGAMCLPLTACFTIMKAVLSDDEPTNNNDVIIEESVDDEVDEDVAHASDASEVTEIDGFWGPLSGAYYMEVIDGKWQAYNGIGDTCEGHGTIRIDEPGYFTFIDVDDAGAETTYEKRDDTLVNILDDEEENILINYHTYEQAFPVEEDDADYEDPYAANKKFCGCWHIESEDKVLVIWDDYLCSLHDMNGESFTNGGYEVDGNEITVSIGDNDPLILEISDGGNLYNPQTGESYENIEDTYDY